MAEEVEEAKIISRPTVHTQLIWNPFYNGCLTERLGENGRPINKVFRTEQLKIKPGKKRLALVNVYEYINGGQPHVDGTYVVLEFVNSSKFFVVIPNKDKPILRLGDGDFDPENAEQIRTTADQRVFKKIPTRIGGKRGVVFAWPPDVDPRDPRELRYAITVSPNPDQPADLELLSDVEPIEIEGQLFRLLDPKLRSSEDGESLEVVP